MIRRPETRLQSDAHRGMWSQAWPRAGGACFHSNTNAGQRLADLKRLTLERIIRTARIVAAIVLFGGVLGGCSSGTNALIDTARNVIGSGVDVSNVRLAPNIRYLRVTVSGRVALLALGYIESHPNGPVEVWYSAEREVLRFQNGRLIGAVGLTTEWRNVSIPQLPRWADLARREQAFKWERSRDLMPGYRSGIRDSLVLRVVPPVSGSELRGIARDSLVWFEERADLGQMDRVTAFFGSSITSDLALPPAIYAVDPNRGAGQAIYGEQCISRDLCLTWQEWPPATSIPIERK